MDARARTSSLLTLVAVTAVAAVAASPAPDASALPRYAAYVSCGLPNGPGRHVCDDSSVRYVNFTDRIGSFTSVRECLSHAGHATRCRTFRTGQAGVRHRHSSGPLGLGLEYYRWYVSGHLVASWAVRDVPESD